MKHESGIFEQVYKFGEAISIDNPNEIKSTYEYPKQWYPTVTGIESFTNFQFKHLPWN